MWFLLSCTLATSPLLGIEAVSGERLFYDGQYLDAATHYRQALNTASGDAALQLRLRLADALIHADSIDQALEVLEPLTTAAASLMKGSCHLARGDYRTALPLMESYAASGEVPFHTESLHYLGVCQAQLGQLAEAKATFTSLLPSAAARLELAKLALLESNSQEVVTLIDNSNAVDGEAAFLLGEAALLDGDYSRAIAHYSKSLEKREGTWLKRARWQLALSCLHIAQEQSREIEERLNALDQALALLPSDDEESMTLLRARCLIIQGTLTGNEAAYAAAHALLDEGTLPPTALLLAAEAASTYAERNNLYSAYLASYPSAQGWQMKGDNALSEGRRLLTLNRCTEAAECLAVGAAAFKHALPLFSTEERQEAWHCLQQLVETHTLEGTPDSLRHARTLVTSLWDENRQLAPNTDAAALLYGQLALKTAHNRSQLVDALQRLDQERHSDGSYTHDNRLLAGSLAYHLNEWEAAEAAFSALIETHYQEQALFWLAATKEQAGAAAAAVRELRQRLYREYPRSPHAAEAYLRCWSFYDYLYGTKEAFEHLRNMAAFFPEAPELIYAHYLLGLVYKQGRKESDGRHLQKRSLSAAIDAFEQVERHYDTLDNQTSAPLHDIYQRATLEKGKAHLAIGKQSQGAKRALFFDYATTTLEALSRTLPAGSPLNDECRYTLAQAYHYSNHTVDAEQLLAAMLEYYRQSKVTRSYYLCRCWHLLATIQMARGDYIAAYSAFSNADDAAKGKVLTPDEQLELWLDQSHCLRMMGNLSQAMKQLSMVINKDCISSLRLKAMLWRAELYEEQGRHDLARRQLEALAQKSGPWALQAKEKLSQHYRCPHDHTH